MACAAVVCLSLGGAGRAQASPGNSSFGRSHRAVCAAVPRGFARCNAEIVTNATGAPLIASAPAGYGPSELGAAYALPGLPAAAGGGQTLAIVDAYDDPNAEQDLGVYRAQYGLSSCTSANGCFEKVNQRGSTNAYPAADSGWAQEISLDLDMAAAVCPNCRLLLVEADSSGLGDLMTAVDRAATLGATQISNSYGGAEYPAETSDESHYDHPGIAITASSGDSGYGVEFPAASRYVTAVGGTRLTRDAGTPGGWSETAWSGAGSGCSAYVAKPAWQTDHGCANRSVADVAAVADPATPVAVYDSVPVQSSSGWLLMGGTSASAVIVAGFDALLGPSAAAPSYPYAHRGAFIDIVSGSTGTCTPAYLCTAGPDWDGPTGLGSIDGAPPAYPPTATTGQASAVGDTAATLSAIVDPNGTSTSVRFIYGTTTGYGTASAQQSIGGAATNQAILTPVSGLAPAMTYHYRIVATADCACRDNTFYGADATFTTTATPAVTVTTSSGSPAPAAAPAPAPSTTATTPAASPSVAPAPAPAPAVAYIAARPATIRVIQAAIVAGKLHVVAELARAYHGAVRVTFLAGRHAIRFTARASGRRLRFTHTLPRRQRHVRTGILTLAYGGDNSSPTKLSLRVPPS